MTDTFEATYAVPMHCQSCANEIQRSLDKIPGNKEVEFNIEKQIMKVKSDIPPSTIIDVVSRDCNKDVIIRGAGESNGSAVCILETDDLTGKVQGLVRMVEINNGNKTLFDLTLNKIKSNDGTYSININENGDISNGLKSCGNIHIPLGEIKVHQHNSKKFFSIDNTPIWKLIGRSITLTNTTNTTNQAIIGVIARSAGIWENDKQVCACSGKTVWEERKDALEHNIIH